MQASRSKQIRGVLRTCHFFTWDLYNVGKKKHVIVCGVSFSGDIQDPPGQGPVQLLQQEGWTRWPAEVPSNPYYSVILWFLQKAFPSYFAFITPTISFL